MQRQTGDNINKELFFLNKLDSDLFNIDRQKINEMRRAIGYAANSMPIHTARDGGGKLKISSHHYPIWQNEQSIKTCMPVLEILEKFTSKKWMEIVLTEAKSKYGPGDRYNLQNVEKLIPYIPTEKSIMFINERNKKYCSKYQVWMAYNKKNYLDCRYSNQTSANKELKIICRFHFSYMNSGTSIKMHRDGQDKLISMMIYMPNSKQWMQNELSTNFFTPKKGWEEHYLEENIDKELDEYLFKERNIGIRPDFTNENIISFIRTNSSWHNFEYPKSLNIGTRVSLNINFHLP